MDGQNANKSRSAGGGGGGGEGGLQHIFFSWFFFFWRHLHYVVGVPSAYTRPTSGVKSKNKNEKRGEGRGRFAPPPGSATANP